MLSLKSATIRVVVPLIGSAALFATLAAGTASASPTAPYIREGSVGDGVTCVQDALIWDSIYAPSTGDDGIDGPETNAAIRSFQNANGLVVDGIVGPATGTKLLAIDDAHGETLCYNVVPTYS
jgi:peptidoglycan hydrolase-like protein with peptidoglycan-binding domain